MLNLLRKSAARKRDGARLHDALVSRARQSVFFRDFAVPDSIDGRFDLLVFHAWMVLAELKERRAEQAMQGLTDALFTGFDEGLRELGSGDMGLGRRMKKIADAFYGRLKAYGESADEGAMHEALERNLYRGADAPHAGEVARYVLAAKARLDGQDLASGDVDFGPLP